MSSVGEEEPEGSRREAEGYPASPLRRGEGERPGWRARLNLAYERRGSKTVLAGRRHDGPLRVQKPLYPEGPEVCHTVILHPPGGIAGGDRLEVSLDLSAGARALATTPGAGKWYRSDGRGAEQRVRLSVGAGASLEWLPQEAIVFDGAIARQELGVDLAAGASYVGWDLLCLGRTASGERFARGLLSQRTEVRREGRLLWRDGLDLAGGGPLLGSPAGLAGQPVCATLVAACAGAGRDWAEAARGALAGVRGLAGATALPGLVLVRYLGASAEEARRALAAVWSTLRPLAFGREASPPRIWNT